MANPPKSETGEPAERLITEIDVGRRELQQVMSGDGGRLTRYIAFAIRETQKAEPGIRPTGMLIQVRWEKDE